MKLLLERNEVLCFIGGISNRRAVFVNEQNMKGSQESENESRGEQRDVTNKRTF